MSGKNWTARDDVLNYGVCYIPNFDLFAMIRVSSLYLAPVREQRNVLNYPQAAPILFCAIP